MWKVTAKSHGWPVIVVYGSVLHLILDSTWVWYGLLPELKILTLVWHWDYLLCPRHFWTRCIVKWREHSWVWTSWKYLMERTFYALNLDLEMHWHCEDLGILFVWESLVFGVRGWRTRPPAWFCRNFGRSVGSDRRSVQGAFSTR